ncbi:hypothetical protein SAMN04488490_0954 [Marinobacter sp. LV10R510-11A]|nr:hypothetical protein SAMN04488490_0954 [Marinobacter sp. LV10R510-11A]
MNITIKRPAFAHTDKKESDTKIIETLDIRTQVALESEDQKSIITIQSDPANAFDDIEIALEFCTSISVGTDCLHPGHKAQEFALFKLNSARNVIEFDAASKIVARCYMLKVPSEMTDKDAEADMANRVRDRVLDNGSSPLAGVVAVFRDMLQIERQRAEDMAMVNQQNPHANFFTGSNEEINEIIKLGGLVLINSGLGAGKTKENLLPAFEEACTRKVSPLFVSPRRSQIAPMKGDPRHYTNAGPEGFSAPGVVGVSNSVIGLPAFEWHRENTKMVIVDEFEQMLTHNASNAIGRGKLTERAAITAGTIEAIKKAAQDGTAVLADALLSDYTVTKLSKALGMTVTVATKTHCNFAHNINLHPTKAALIATAQAMLEIGKNILVISDESHNPRKDDLEGTFNTLNKSATGESITLDGDFFGNAEKSYFVSNLDLNLKSYQLVVASTVLSSGVSIESDHFDAVFVIAAGTVLPTEVIQSTRRVRKLKETHLVFTTHKRKRTNSVGLVFALMASKDLSDNDDYNQENLDKLWATSGVQDVVERVAYENGMRTNYNNRTLMMAEALGFTIKRMSANEADEIRAKAAMKEGNEEAENARIDRILTAEDISREQADERRKSDQMSRGQEYQIENYELREFYKTNTLDVDLIKADKSGRQRKQIAGLRMGVESAVRNLSAFDANKRKVIRKLMAVLDADLPAIMRGGSAIITKEHAKSFAEWTVIKRNKVTVGGKSTTASQAYNQAFDGRRISVRQATRSVISVLREELGMSVKEHKKDSWIVSVSNTRRAYFDMHMNGVSRLMEKFTKEDEAARDKASGYYDPTTGHDIMKWFEQTRASRSSATDSSWAPGMAFSDLMEALNKKADRDEIFMIGEIECRVLTCEETKPSVMKYRKSRCCA